MDGRDDWDTCDRNDADDDFLVHCSMLAEDAIKSAISNYYTKNPKARATDLGGTGVSMPKVEVEMMDTPAPQTATA